MMRPTYTKTFEMLRGAAGLLFVAQGVSATSITLDYSLDTGNFFGVGSDARTALEAARDFFEVRITDILAPIIPNLPGNTWTATNPTTGAGFLFNNLTLGDEIIVFVDARNLTGSVLGVGGPGGAAASCTQAFVDSVFERGQGFGVDTTEFAPWGGSLVLDSLATWNFDVNAGPASGENDGLSVLLHEFGHVLGFGTAASFFNMTINGNTQFAGATTGIVDLHSDSAHWENGTMSTVAGGSESYIGALAGMAQDTAMDPSIQTGTRKLFTDLDLAALDDIGWDIENPPSVIPLPAGLWMLVSGIALLGFNRAPVRRTVGSET